MAKKIKKRLSLPQVLIYLSVLMIFIIGVYLFSTETKELNDNHLETNPTLLSSEVLSYEALVTQYAAQYNVSTDINILMAIMQQESAGRVLDVMQSSESAGYPPNYFTQPEASIAQGVAYYAHIKEKIIRLWPDQTSLNTEQKIQLAMQSYNFGQGFIDYIAEHNQFNDGLIVQFSHLQDNSCSQEKRQRYGSCYGDIYYYQHVQRYVDISDNRVDGTWGQ